MTSYLVPPVPTATGSAPEVEESAHRERCVRVCPFVLVRVFRCAEWQCGVTVPAVGCQLASSEPTHPQARVAVVVLRERERRRFLPFAWSSSSSRPLERTRESRSGELRDCGRAGPHADAGAALHLNGGATRVGEGATRCGRRRARQGLALDVAVHHRGITTVRAPRASSTLTLSLPQHLPSRQTCKLPAPPST